MAKHNLYGEMGEKLACKFLKKQGYKILEHNYSSKSGEVDIIALETKRARKKRTLDFKNMSKQLKNENVVCFVEVKSRENCDYGRPSEFVDKTKTMHYEKAKNSYFAKNPKFVNMQYRFDIIEVVGDRVENYIINGF